MESEQQKHLRLLNRQVEDILASIQRIDSGDNSPESIESLSKYANDLQSFIISYIENDELVNFAKTFPSIDYRRNKTSLWKILIFPMWFFNVYQNILRKNKTLGEIRELRSKISEFQVLLMLQSS